MWSRVREKISSLGEKIMGTKVEFKGGPWDGEERAMPELMTAIEVPHFSQQDVSLPLLSAPLAPINPPTSSYKLMKTCDGVWYYLWDGAK